MPLIPPTKQTLSKYGLSLDEWQALADAQDHRCAVCLQEPTKGRLHIEHHHAPGWKHLPPEERKRWVRCLACFRCNTTFLGRGITLERARNVVAVLEAFEARRPPDPKPIKKPRKARKVVTPQPDASESTPTV